LQQHRHIANIAVVMGASGSGKTTVGRALAQRVGWLFEEGDSLHPPENVAKMSRGEALNDADRMPWLSAVAERIDELRGRGESAVISCSALKRRYRRIIIGDRPELRLIYLDGSRELIGRRLQDRKGHFMPASLLDSQLAALEPPGPDEHPITVSVDLPVTAIVDRLVKALSQAPHNVRHQVSGLTDAS
jgi:carbohydrate kinase (thermoresistant glucokinase family)